MALMHIVSTTTPVSTTTHGPTTPAAATAAAGAAFVRGSDELVRDLRGHVRDSGRGGVVCAAGSRLLRRSGKGGSLWAVWPQSIVAIDGTPVIGLPLKVERVNGG